MTNQSESDANTLIVWLDNALLLLGGFILLTMLLLALASAKPVDPKNDQASADGVIIEARWPDGSNLDVDLWLQCPGDVPVGYSRKQGRVCNLLRDDLGNYDDGLGNLRYENAYSRGIPAGEYIVNVGLYRIGSPELVPVTVAVKVSVKTGRMGITEIARAKVVLTRTSEEQTAVRFTLDGNQHLISGSVNHLYKPLWIGG